MRAATCARATQRYDVIVADNFHPARSGSGALYTVEHFAGRARAARAGRPVLPVAAAAPARSRDAAQHRAVVPGGLSATAGRCSPATAWRRRCSVWSARATRAASTSPALRERLRASTLPRARSTALGLEDELAVLGSFVAGPQALRRFAGDAPANTDDRPVVAYRAPRITYAPDSLPRDRLIALLRELSIDPAELVAPPPTPPGRSAWPPTGRRAIASSSRAATCARRRRVDEMLAQVREPLLSVLRISPDFRPAYDPLLRMATALARGDRSGGARAARRAGADPAGPPGSLPGVAHTRPRRTLAGADFPGSSPCPDNGGSGSRRCDSADAHGSTSR